MLKRTGSGTSVLAGVLGTLLLGGCGTAGARHAAGRSRHPAPTASHHASEPAAKRRSKTSTILAKVDVSSDRIVAEGKLQIASGAPSDAEIRKEIEAAKKAGIILPSGESAASFEAGARYKVSAQVETPLASWNPRSKPIAGWIVPVLEWAAEHGWSGTVTSGYRTFYEQEQLNAAGAFSAPAGLSNHETTVYPGGAVDVTHPGQLIEVLRGYTGPHRLIGGVLGPADPEHFSATGD
jgi:hypothetical protein